MAQFFIDRPIFAWVLSLLMIIGGLVSFTQLPVSAYPSIAPPQISLSASYPGASAQVIEDTVTSLIEEEMNGMEGLKYVTSESSRTGRASITIVFETGTDIDIAGVDVQNRLKRVEPRLPAIVQSQGINLDKTRPDFLMMVTLYSPNGSLSKVDLADYIDASILGDIRRLDGVGTAELFGGVYAMRIWIDPKRMASYDLRVEEIIAAVEEQNAQLATGEVGGIPYVEGQQINATVMVPARLSTPEEFGNIIIRSSTQGALVRLSDVAKIEQDEASYVATSLFNGQESAAFGVKLTNTGNALTTATAVINKMKELESFFPDDIAWATPYNTSLFIEASIKEVAHTLIEAVFLVVIVMFVFLQNWRTTVIPLIVIPVSLIGTFIGMNLFGFSINMLTLFGMVLAIGIVVDDAILVVENIERIIKEEHLSAYKATKKAMKQISGAIIGTTAVLTSVFIPMSLFGGSVGEIFKQFAMTIVISVTISAFVALSLTPAVGQSLLISNEDKASRPKGLFYRITHRLGLHFLVKPFNWFFGLFNALFDRFRTSYIGLVKKSVTRTGMVFVFILYFLIIAADIFLFKNLPSSFVPSEDQGFIAVTGMLPAGATRDRTLELVNETDAWLKAQPEVVNVISIPGIGFAGNGQNTYLSFVTLKSWDERQEEGLRLADHLIADTNAQFSKYSNIGMAIAVNLPPIPGMGSELGFDLRLQDRGNVGMKVLQQAAQEVIALARQNPAISPAIRLNTLGEAPQVVLNIDRVKARSLNIDLSALNSLVQIALGSTYINDYVINGNVREVWLQADKDARQSPETILKLQVPNNEGDLVDLSEIATAHWTTGSAVLNRYNGVPALPIAGAPAPGVSSGVAQQAMADIIQNQLPKKMKEAKGIGFEWSGQALEESESQGQTGILFTLSIIVVFLALAALYESWSIPIAVMLVVPLGILGCLIGAYAFNVRHIIFDIPYMTSLSNDVYFKVGIITIIGLSAKNAIMIVEFARELQQEGKTAYEAVLETCHIRFRPILMTSFAFVFGVLPLAIATGAGAASRQAIGVGVMSGMLSTTFLAIFFVPVFYLFVQKLFPMKPKKADLEAQAEASI